MSTTQSPPQTPDLDAMQRTVRGRLGGLRTRVRALIALDALVRCVAVMLGLAALAIVVDYWLELSLPMRIGYWLVTLATGLHFIYHNGIKPLSKALGPIQLAQAVDLAKGHDAEEQLAPRVATVLQLPSMFGDEAALSDTMIRDAVGRSYRSLEQRSFSGLIDQAQVMRCIGLLLVALLVASGVGAGMQQAGDNVLGTWAQRWLMLSDVSYPRNTQITVMGLDEDNRLIIPAGENTTLRALITNQDGRPIDGARVTLKTKGGKMQAMALTRFDESDFRLDMAPLTEPATAIVRAGDQSLRFEITPAARPRLTAIKLTHTHPSTPNTPTTIDFDGAEGEVSLLELNEVELRLTANVPIATARYADDQQQDGEAVELPPIQRASENTFMIKWTHQSRQRLRIELISASAGLVSYPIPISVGLKTDRKPSVRLRSSGVGPRITPSALIPLTAEARDDYGLLSMGLRIVRVRTGEDAGEEMFDLALVEPPSEDAELPRELSDRPGLEVDEYAVRPTDVLRLSAVASDDRYVGSQAGESTRLTFRVVTHKELFREIITRQQQARATFRQAIEDCKDIQSVLRQAKSGAQASAQARRFRAVQRSVWKVNRELERSAEEMRLNRLGGDKEGGNQAYESMKSTILNPLAKLHDQTMSDQRDALDSADNANTEQLTALADGQQDLVNEMTTLLTKMDRWDELLDAINQLTEVIDQQKQLREKLKELEEERFDDLFD